MFDELLEELGLEIKRINLKKERYVIDTIVDYSYLDGTGIYHQGTNCFIVDPVYEFIHGPYGECDWSTGAFFIVRTWEKARVGIIHFSVPIESITPTIHWMEDEVTNLVFMGKGEFRKLNVCGKTIGKCQWQGRWIDN